MRIILGKAKRHAVTWRTTPVCSSRGPINAFCDRIRANKTRCKFWFTRCFELHIASGQENLITKVEENLRSSFIVMGFLPILSGLHACLALILTFNVISPPIIGNRTFRFDFRLERRRRVVAKVRPKGGVLNGLLVGIVYRKFHQCQGFIPIVMIWPHVVANHVLDYSVHSFRLTVSLWMERCRKCLSRAH